MVLELCRRGESVVVVDDLSTGNRELVPKNVPLIVGRVGNNSLISSVIATYGVHAIIHFAGSIVVPESTKLPLKYYRNNTVQTQRLMETTVKCGVGHFLFSSTAAVYGNPTVVPIPESASPSPINPYGCSKLMSELMLRDTAAAHGLRFVILRYFNVAGADPQLRSGQCSRTPTHLLKIASQAVTGQREYLEIFGTDYDTPDGTAIRDYIHVADLAAAHSAALRYLLNGGESTTFNCGYGEGYSVLQVINAVRRVAKRKLEVRRAGRRVGDPSKLIANADRLKNLLGWRPVWNDLDSIVEHALAWEWKLASARPRPTLAPRLRLHPGMPLQAGRLAS
jgi:UDP-glucose 4-epimerase